MISQPANPVSQAESDLIWFPVRITSVLGGGAYTFQEVWITPVAIQDKVGGRYNGSFDPAYPIDGNTFSVTAEGSAVQVLARRAMGIGGVGWELKGFGSPVPDIWASLGGYSLALDGLQTVFNPLDGAAIGYDTNVFATAQFSLFASPTATIYCGFASWLKSAGTSPPNGTNLRDLQIFDPLAFPPGTPVTLAGVYGIGPSLYLCPCFKVVSGSGNPALGGQFCAMPILKRTIN